jgi:hypothetical protein
LSGLFPPLPQEHRLNSNQIQALLDELVAYLDQFFPRFSPPL